MDAWIKMRGDRRHGLRKWELLCFLAQETTVPHVDGVGIENGKEEILCEEMLGRNLKKCQKMSESI